MDIEKLKRKRQLNVQEQNYVTEYRILSEASYWRKNGLPKGLSTLIKIKGIDEEKCIVIDYMQDYPGCSTDEGIIVTEEGRFFEFEMDLSKNKEQIEELYIWNDVTESIHICKSDKGTGSSRGYLILKVLKILND
mgnify:CR=1 FL=1